MPDASSKLFLSAMVFMMKENDIKNRYPDLLYTLVHHWLLPVKQAQGKISHEVCMQA